jgi:hypothetical protein
VNPRDNPYTPGAGRRPRVLAGRDDELEQFRLVVDRLTRGEHERSMIFHGLRGIGKTVVLLEMETLAREQNWASTAPHEVGSQADFRVTFARLAASLLRSMSLKERMKQRAIEALRVVKAFSALAPGGVGLQLDISPATGTADTGDPEEDLADLLEAIGEVAQAGGIGALFLIDEMQNLDAGSLAAICMAFHRISQRGLPVALAAAGLPTLPRLLREAKPYASRLFTYHEIGALTVAEATRALVAPAERQGVSYVKSAVNLVIQATHGYPYFIQEYGRVLWNEVEAAPVSRAEVEGIHDLVTAALATEFFEPQFELATNREQRYLMAMADLGDGPFRSSAVNKHLGHESPGGSSQERDALLKKELIWAPRRGVVEFTIPRFSEFIRQTYPLDRGDG